MKIIHNFDQVSLVSDVKILTKFFGQQYGTVSEKVLEHVKIHFSPGNTVILYSGAWRFKLNTNYIESDYLRDLEFDFPKFTYFINQSKEDLWIKIANKFANTAFIDSPLTRYKSISELNDFFKKFPGCVAAINTNLIIYNRLTTSLDQITEQLNGQLIDQFIIASTK